MGTKVCLRCKVEKDFSLFSYSTKFSDGYQPWCKVCMNSYNKKYFKEHPEKRQEYKYNRKSRETNLPSFTLKDLFAKYFFYCAYCSKNLATGVDHVIPLSMNGADDISNIVPACKECNSSKGSKSLLVWLLQRVTT